MGQVPLFCKNRICRECHGHELESNTDLDWLSGYKSSLLEIVGWLFSQLLSHAPRRFGDYKQQITLRDVENSVVSSRLKDIQDDREIALAICGNSLARSNITSSPLGAPQVVPRALQDVFRRRVRQQRDHHLVHRGIVVEAGRVPFERVP